MTPLAPHADQAVRHAVDAYVDGRLLPMFEGDASFETRNSTYRILDGVLFSAPEQGLVGAELVGWLIEFVARAEVSQTWRPGARAVLVDTRNDGIKGPHIIVTSATRAFRIDRPKERVPSAPALPAARLATPPSAPPAAKMFATAPPPPVTGSRVTQDGSSGAHAWRLSDLPPLPPAPAIGLRDAQARDVRQSLPRAVPRAASWELPPPAPVPRPRPLTIPPPAPVPMVVRPSTLPPPPPPRPLPRVLPPQPAAYDDGFVARRIAATVGAAIAVADDLDDVAPTARMEPGDDRSRTYRQTSSRSASRLSQGASVGGSRGYLGPPPPASVPFLLSRSHQRGVPLR